MKTGDPRETLRRASMQPSQIAEAAGITTRQRKRVSLESHHGPGTPEVGGPLLGRRGLRGGALFPLTVHFPQSKKATSCFPRPMTPRHEGRRQSTTEAQKKAASTAKQVSGGLGGPRAARGTRPDSLLLQGDRRQSMAFSILNTPKKLGNSLLRRGALKKAPATASPNTRSGTRRSPRITAAASPRVKGKVGTPTPAFLLGLPGSGGLTISPPCRQSTKDQYQ